MNYVYGVYYQFAIFLAAVCGDNEKIVDCYNSCSPRTCPNAIHDSGIVCPAICETDKCDCNDGYLRNKCGLCVPEADCLHSCACKSRETEEMRCVNECSVRSCSNIVSDVEPNCSTHFCTDICDCKLGYARKWTGECVLEQQCDERW